MLPVCSATPSCSSRSQVHSCLKPHLPLGKTFDIRGVVEDRVVVSVSNGIHPRDGSLKAQATKFLCSSVTERPEVSISREFINELPVSRKWIQTLGTIRRDDLTYVENSSALAMEDNLLNLPDQFSPTTEILQEPAIPKTVSTSDAVTDVVSMNPTSASKNLVVADDALTNLKTNVEDFLSGLSDSIDASVGKGEQFVKSTLDGITSSFTNTSKSITENFDNAANSLLSNVDSTGDLAGSRLTGFSNDIKKTMSKAGTVFIDVLRQAIIALEYSLANGTRSAVYYYGSAKELLPAEVKDLLTSTEVKAAEILGPIGSAFNQIYIAIRVLETNLGLDPNDPIVPLFLFLGTSATLGISYWALTYGGYAGDLSPKEVLELLKEEKNAALIDVRPEGLRERDGIPDLRRGARFKYASVDLPKVDDSAMKLMKSKKNLENALVAAVIRNLKIVEDRSMVMILDADGTQSKDIARSLRKLGSKKAYLVQGGFQSWASNGLRIKKLKPETTITILSEEAEAILEDIKPTPLQFLGYGVGLMAGTYALFEWEKTLQYIAIIGIGQTIYRRLASYKNSQDLKQDVRFLLSPVSLGGQAFSWAAGKFNTNKIGLPTSPSSSAVQDRVLQAAAKHESQPSDLSEENQDPSQESPAPVSERVDLSEA